MIFLISNFWGGFICGIASLVTLFFIAAFIFTTLAERDPDCWNRLPENNFPNSKKSYEQDKTKKPA